MPVCAIVKTWLSQGSWNLLSVWRQGERDQWGIVYCLHYRETCAPTCAEYKFWAIRRLARVFKEICRLRIRWINIHALISNCQYSSSESTSRATWWEKNALDQDTAVTPESINSRASNLNLLLLVANFAKAKWCKTSWKWLKPWHIWEQSARAFQWIPTWWGFNNFRKSLCSCALDESNISIGRDICQFS